MSSPLLPLRGGTPRKAAVKARHTREDPPHRLGCGAMSVTFSAILSSLRAVWDPVSGVLSLCPPFSSPCTLVAAILAPAEKGSPPPSLPATDIYAMARCAVGGVAAVGEGVRGVLGHSSPVESCLLVGGAIRSVPEGGSVQIRPAVPLPNLCWVAVGLAHPLSGDLLKNGAVVAVTPHEGEREAELTGIAQVGTLSLFPQRSVLVTVATSPPVSSVQYVVVPDEGIALRARASATPQAMATARSLGERCGEVPANNTQALILLRRLPPDTTLWLVLAALADDRSHIGTPYIHPVSCAADGECMYGVSDKEAVRAQSRTVPRVPEICVAPSIRIFESQQQQQQQQEQQPAEALLSEGGTFAAQCGGTETELTGIKAAVASASRILTIELVRGLRRLFHAHLTAVWDGAEKLRPCDIRSQHTVNVAPHGTRSFIRFCDTYYSGITLVNQHAAVRLRGADEPFALRPMKGHMMVSVLNSLCGGRRGGPWILDWYGFVLLCTFSNARARRYLHPLRIAYDARIASHNAPSTEKEFYLLLRHVNSGGHLPLDSLWKAFFRSPSPSFSDTVLALFPRAQQIAVLGQSGEVHPNVHLQAYERSVKKKVQLALSLLKHTDIVLLRRYFSSIVANAVYRRSRRAAKIRACAEMELEHCAVLLRKYYNHMVAHHEWCTVYHDRVQKSKQLMWKTNHDLERRFWGKLLLNSQLKRKRKRFAYKLEKMRIMHERELMKGHKIHRRYFCKWMKWFMLRQQAYVLGHMRARMDHILQRKYFRKLARWMWVSRLDWEKALGAPPREARAIIFSCWMRFVRRERITRIQRWARQGQAQKKAQKLREQEQRALEKEKSASEQQMRQYAAQQLVGWARPILARRIAARKSRAVRQGIADRYAALSEMSPDEQEAEYAAQIIQGAVRRKLRCRQRYRHLKLLHATGEGMRENAAAAEQEKNYAAAMIQRTWKSRYAARRQHGSDYSTPARATSTLATAVSAPETTLLHVTTTSVDAAHPAHSTASAAAGAKDATPGTDQAAQGAPQTQRTAPAESAVVLQRWWRWRSACRNVKDKCMMQSKGATLADEELAASVIQRAWKQSRGAGGEAIGMPEGSSPAESLCLPKSHKAHPPTPEAAPRDTHHAAFRIQAVWRGHKSRVEVHRVRAARKIAKWWRSYR